MGVRFEQCLIIFVFFQEPKVTPPPVCPPICGIEPLRKEETLIQAQIKLEPTLEAKMNGGTKLCALKERRLQEFYREQRLLEEVPPLKQEPTEAPSPLQELRSLAGLLEEKNDRNNNSQPAVATGGCEECGLQVEGLEEMGHHVRTVHGHSPPPYSCTLCSSVFTHRAHWTAHQKLHQESKPEHTCTHCGKTFVTRASLKVDFIFTLNPRNMLKRRIY